MSDLGTLASLLPKKKLYACFTFDADAAPKLTSLYQTRRRLNAFGGLRKQRSFPFPQLSDTLLSASDLDILPLP